jgi:hypothetical protein
MVRVCEVGFEVSPSFSAAVFSFQRRQALMNCPVAKIFAYPTFICCEGPMGTPPCLQIASTLLNLLEESLHWLLGIPCSAHVLEVDLQVDFCDVAVGFKEVVQHASC